MELFIFKNFSKHCAPVFNFFFFCLFQNHVNIVPSIKFTPLSLHIFSHSTLSIFIIHLQTVYFVLFIFIIFFCLLRLLLQLRLSLLYRSMYHHHVNKLSQTVRPPSIPSIGYFCLFSFNFSCDSIPYVCQLFILI